LLAWFTHVVDGLLAKTRGDLLAHAFDLVRARGLRWLRSGRAKRPSRAAHFHAKALPLARRISVVERKTIAVIGATGAQGGGLVRAILKDPAGRFAARALTRDVSSAKAR